MIPKSVETSMARDPSAEIAERMSINPSVEVLYHLIVVNGSKWGYHSTNGVMPLRLSSEPAVGMATFAH